MNIGHKASIGSLEKIALNAAKTVEAKNPLMTVEVETFRAGRGGQELYGTSFVELTIESNCGEVFEQYRVYSSGFGEVISTAELKKKIFAFI